MSSYKITRFETQISQYDFDIEQAKQRTYSYLTPELIKEFFQKAVCGDIESNGARKLIVRNFIREVILYKDKVVITFNFTDQHITKKRLPDSIEEVEMTAKQAEKSASKNKSGVYKNASTPPLGKNTNTETKSELVFFFFYGYIGIVKKTGLYAGNRLVVPFYYILLPFKRFFPTTRIKRYRRRQA